jgi:O-antigen ligase
VNTRVHAQNRWQWSLPAILPAIALFVAPWLASPFVAAKTALLLIAGALAGIACLKNLSTSRFPHRLLLWSAAIWASVLIVSALHAQNWAESWHVVAPLAAAAVFSIAMLQRRVSVDTILRAIATSATIVSAFAIIGHFGYDLPRLIGGIAAPGRMRTASTLGNPLFVASFLSASIWAVAALKISIRWRFVWALHVFIGMAVTTERTCVVALGLGGLVFLCGKKQISRRWLHPAGLAVALLLVLAAAYYANPRSLSTTVQGRVFLWRTALRSTTVLGGGPGSFYRIYNQNLRASAQSISASDFHFINYETDAYNIFVQAIVETGLLGLVAMLLFFGAWYRLAWAVRKEMPVRCALAGVAAFLAAGLSDDPLSRPEGMILLAMWMAVPLLVLFRDNPAIFKLESSRSGLGKIWTGVLPVLSLLLLAAAISTAFASYAVHAGELAEGRGDWAHAERWDRLALRFDPAQRDARYNLVRVLAQEEQYQASWEESEKALYWVNEAELHLMRIRILPLLGRTQAARDELMHSRSEFPWSKELRIEAVEDSN